MRSITMAVPAALLTVLLLTACSAEEPVAVPDVSGMNAAEAQNTLENAGFEVDLEADSGFVLKSSNWDVVAQVPNAGVDAKDGDTITLSVSKQDVETSAEQMETATPTPEPAAVAPVVPDAPVAPAEDSGALTRGMAITVCDRLGKENAPYGWDADFLLDGTAIEQDGGLFLKAGVDVTNAYDAEGRFTVECFVTGTQDAPVIESFDVY
jgi:hypothetical protein